MPASPRDTVHRIALFTGAYNHIADGVSLTLNRVVKYLEKAGHHVLVFAPTSDDPQVDHKGRLIPVKSLKAPGRPDYLVSLGLGRDPRADLDAFDPTIVHVATPDFLGLGARKYALKNDLHLVASYHTHFSSYLSYYHLNLVEGALWRYLKWFYSACSQIYVPSLTMQRELRAHGIDEGLLHWPRGVETDRFSPAHRSQEWRLSKGFANDDIVVAFISRLVWEKGLHVFADMVEILRHRPASYRFLLVGDGPARSELVERLPDAVFTGHLSGKELATAYASSDVFVFPSDTETFGNVTLESMSSGVPTVCARATGSGDLVEEAVTGYLAPPGNAAAFADAVQRLEGNERRAAFGDAARSKAMNYDWTQVLSMLVRYYDDL